MGRQYYCEFCEKSFADNPSSRKNHLNGTGHKANRENYYKMFLDPEIRLQNERNKKPCKNFFKGTCMFGDTCRFGHMTEDGFQALEAQVIERRRLKIEAEQKPSMAEDKKTEDLTNEIDLTLPTYPLPPILLNIPNLPLSILPPPPDVFKQLIPEEWG